MVHVMIHPSLMDGSSQLIKSNPMFIGFHFVASRKKINCYFIWGFCPTKQLISNHPFGSELLRISKEKCLYGFRKNFPKSKKTFYNWIEYSKAGLPSVGSRLDAIPLWLINCMIAQVVNCGINRHNDFMNSTIFQCWSRYQSLHNPVAQWPSNLWMS